MESLAESHSFASVAPGKTYIPGKSSMVEELATLFSGEQGAQNKGLKEVSNSDAAGSDFKYIIIGSGMGGGIVARHLVSLGEKIMLFEKGRVPFKTHCLNTSRLHFDHQSQKGRGRDNEVVFDKVKKEYTVAAADKADFGGGSYFALGGRSLFWSLEAPEVDQTVMRNNFPSAVADSLYDTVTTTEVDGGDTGDGQGGGETYTQTTTTEGWYTKALRILANAPPGNTNYPTGQITAKAQTKVDTAITTLAKAIQTYKQDDPVPVPNGAEFATSANLYYFPQNAYSTVDWLLDRILTKDDPSKILPGVEVTRFTLNEDGNCVDSLDLTDITGTSKTISVKNANIILCAGTVDTATIALRSGKKDKTDFKDAHPLVGKGITDHEIWMAKYWKEISATEADEQPLELCCHVKICGHPALLTICTHAEKFYGHGFANGSPSPPKELVNVLNIMFEFEAPLNEAGSVALDSKLDPIVTIKRKRLDTSKAFTDELIKALRAIRTAFGFPGDDDPVLAKWGSVAHEVGTMRIDRPNGGDGDGVTQGVVDENLRVHGVNNLFVCDLSVFPLSPMANPSRTLTALGMRLAEYLKTYKSDGDAGGQQGGSGSDSQGGKGRGKKLPTGTGLDCPCRRTKVPPYVCPLTQAGLECRFGSW